MNDSLRFLCVSGNDLCGIGEDDSGDVDGYDLTGVASLFRALQVNTRLRTLKIAENDLGNDGAKHAADALRENKSLRALDVHGNSLFAVLEEELAAVSASRGREEKGDEDSELEDPPPSVIGCSVATESALAEVTSIAQFLVEEVARRAAQGSSHTAVALPDSSADILSSTGGDVEQAVAVPHEFSGLDGGGAFLCAVGASEHLESVDLSWNDMGPRSASLLAQSLRLNSVLHYLDLHGNPIGDSGMGALASFLAGDTCALGMLCIQRVGMTEVGALQLAEALGVNRSVTKLNMSCNSVGAAGGEKLARCLRRNTTLAGSPRIYSLPYPSSYLPLLTPRPVFVDLNLRSCGLSSEGIAHVANMLQYNTALTTLKFVRDAYIALRFVTISVVL